VAYLGIALVALAVALAWLAWRRMRHDPTGRKLFADRAPRSGTLPGKLRRPRPIPSTPFEVDERPTLAHMERVPMWPNRYARPIDLSASDPSTPDKGRRPDQHRP
jgi:hypothetical protein